MYLYSLSQALGRHYSVWSSLEPSDTSSTSRLRLCTLLIDQGLFLSMVRIRGLRVMSAVLSTSVLRANYGEIGWYYVGNIFFFRIWLHIMCMRLNSIICWMFGCWGMLHNSIKMTMMIFHIGIDSLYCHWKPRTTAAHLAHWYDSNNRLKTF